MNLFLFVRNSLGIGQEALAQLLGVHLSTLKMAETGRRTLPTEAMERLTWMANFLEPAGEAGEEGARGLRRPAVQNRRTPDKQVGEAGEEELFTPEKVEDVLRKIRSKKRKADKEAEALGTQYRQMQRRQAFETAFHSQFPAEKYPSEASRISAMAFDARTFLTHRDEEARLEIFSRQVGLEAMIAWLEKKL